MDVTDEGVSAGRQSRHVLGPLAGSAEDLSVGDVLAGLVHDVDVVRCGVLVLEDERERGVRSDGELGRRELQVLGDDPDLGRGAGAGRLDRR